MFNEPEITSVETYSEREAHYLEQMALSDFGRSYKQEMFSALDVRSGQTAIDLGCGVGMDLETLADGVTESGIVVGFDHDQDLVCRAQERLADRPWCQVQLSDIHALPLSRDSVHRARADRVLQHVSDPGQVVAEAGRVLQAGGRVVFGEPDWYTLSIDYPEIDIASTYTRYITEEVIRNPAIGRQLPRLASAAGLEIVNVLATTALFRDFTVADRALSIRRFTQSAISDGYLLEETAQTWLKKLATEPCLTSVNLYIVVAEVPQS